MTSYRNVVFANNEYYHIFNRSVGNDPIFEGKINIRRALELLNFYRFKQSIRYSFYKRSNQELQNANFEKQIHEAALIDIYAYCLMPNHFHLLLRQNKENGISTFLSTFQNSFAKYYNTKSQRHGALFQRPFKAKYIESNDIFLHISRYIHLNPVTSYIMEIPDLKQSELTSLPFYIGKKIKNSFIDTGLISNILGSGEKYMKFIENQTDYQRSLNKIKGLLLDDRA